MIESIRLMAIIRDVEPVYAAPIAETLLSEGITGIEVSLSDPEKGFGCIFRADSEEVFTGRNLLRGRDGYKERGGGPAGGHENPVLFNAGLR